LPINENVSSWPNQWLNIEMAQLAGWRRGVWRKRDEAAILAAAQSSRRNMAASNRLSVWLPAAGVTAILQ